MTNSNYDGDMEYKTYKPTILILNMKIKMKMLDTDIAVAQSRGG